MKQKKLLTQVIRIRYLKAKKSEKTKILNEFVENSQYNRSYARRILGSKINYILSRKHKKTPVRIKTYDRNVFYPLRKIWAASDGICGKRLKPFLPEMLHVLKRNNEINVTKYVEEKLLKISASTIDRLLSNTKKQYSLKGRSTTKPGTLLKNQIPIRTYADWDDKKPGFSELDLVAFCGDSVKGDYVNVLNLTDVDVFWVSLQAFISKAQIKVHSAVDNIKNRLPFDMLGLDSDNGSEFINDIMRRYCETNKITFTRIRPYRKNDNCYVEQKNFTVVRRYLGYARFDTQEQLALVQKALVIIELYVNFFQPVMKLKEKIQNPDKKSRRAKKIYELAKTPYQRLIESDILSEDKKTELSDLYQNLNPVKLLKEIRAIRIRLDKSVSLEIK